MIKMQQKQVRLTEENKKFVECVKEKTGKSGTQVIRDALRKLQIQYREDKTCDC